MSRNGSHIYAAQVVIPCQDLTAALDFLTVQAGFRLDTIFPADAPTTAVVSGHGVTLRLETDAAHDAPAVLRLLCDAVPNEFEVGGLRVQLAEANPPLTLPPVAQEFIINRQADAAWNAGRAGMEYRDLIPGRLGGRFVASHIRISVGGPVPDYIHFHKVRFQMIYCHAGWARLVYEDQGPPFIIEAGDCVLQPPEIRHRVLEASDSLEVIEIGCPAVHETCVDHELSLPTPQTRPARLFNGQRFVRHVARTAQWQPGPAPGYELRDTGIASVTNGLASVRVIRAMQTASFGHAHNGEFLFYFILQGACRLETSLGSHELQTGDSCVIPAGLEYVFQAGPGMEMLEVTLPATLS